MSERFTFTGDRSLITINDNNGGVEWNSFNSTLTNTINDAGYVTVNEQTQYLSALDDTATTNTSTNDINLEHLNLTTLTTTNPKIEIENHEFLIQQQQEITHNLDEQQKDELVENQVVVYTVEGSDELYGIQLAQDEEGNIQKYQFQFRKTDDGQLEAIPETIQILPLDEDEVAVENNDDLVGLNEQEPEPAPQPEQQRSLQIYVQNDNAEEHILPDRMEELTTDNYNTMLYTEEEHQQKVEDIKPVTIEHINIKQEVQDFINYNNDDNSQNNQQILDESSQTIVEEEEDEDEDEEQQQLEDEYNATLAPETIYTHVLETQDDSSQQQITNEINNFDNLHDHNDGTIKHLVLTPQIGTGNDDSNVRNGQNESDNDEYQVVEGLHITGDIDDELSEQQQQQNQEKMISTLAKTNILKHNQKHPEKIEIKKDNRYFLYFVHNEKENVDSGHLNHTELYKTNPRSILKPCYLSSIQKTESTITTNTTTTTTTITATEYDERLSKRFARNKEAIQARNLYNFINKTTIPLAPVRKDRLPRKQKIKPLDRQDEQIVVQEMMVSSNNSFIESEEQIDTMKKRDIFEITDYVELTDSDSDYNPNNNNNNNKSKKKKKTRRYKLRNQITISDSSSSSSCDDDDDSVIELDDLSDDDDDDDDQHSSDKDVVKKKRGRPPKVDNTNVESPLKKLCLDSNNDDDDDNRKIEIPCPKCSKSFPSQNSLKTHLQHHNLENTINNKSVTTKLQQQSTHKCVKCNELFKNRILLAQHKCPTIFTCTICKKRFTDILDLSKHKRSHIKQQLCRSTTSVVKVSPKKLQTPKPSPPLPPTRKFKSPKSVINAKCKQCGKVCSSLSILNLHMKSHKEYTCVSCKSNFPSKLLLDNHIQKDCVKLTKLQRSLSELKIKKAASSSASTTNTPDPNSKKAAVARLLWICDECTMKFTNSKLFIEHKIEKHNLQTPDKSLLLSVKQQTTKRLFKPKPTHTGIPAKQSLRNIFANMQTQLNQETKH